MKWFTITQVLYSTNWKIYAERDQILNESSKKKKKAKHEDEDVNKFNCSQEQMNNTYIVTCLFRKQEQGRKHREERK